MSLRIANLEVLRDECALTFGVYSDEHTEALGLLHYWRSVGVDAPRSPQTLRTELAGLRNERVRREGREPWTWRSERNDRTWKSCTE